MAAATVIHTVGSRVWVKDAQESWVKAEVQKLEANQLIVALEEGGELRKVDPEDAPLQNTDTRGVEVRVGQLCWLAAGPVGTAQGTNHFGTSTSLLLAAREGVYCCINAPCWLAAAAHSWVVVWSILTSSSASCAASN